MKVQSTLGMKPLSNYYAGNWFLLFSRPADFTPVCTTEFVAFHNKYEKFKALNCELAVKDRMIILPPKDVKTTHERL